MGGLTSLPQTASNHRLTVQRADLAMIVAHILERLDELEHLNLDRNWQSVLQAQQNTEQQSETPPKRGLSTPN